MQVSSNPPQNHQLGSISSSGPTGSSSVITVVTTSSNQIQQNHNVGGGSASLGAGNNGVIDRGIHMSGSSNSLDRLLPSAPHNNPSGSNPGQYSTPPLPHPSMLSLPLQNQIPIHHTSTNNVVSTNITNASGQGPGPHTGPPMPNQDSNTSAGGYFSRSVERCQFFVQSLITMDQPITGSAHSDKEVETPEKQPPKVPVPERKRKRKADDGVSQSKSGENSCGATPVSSSKSSKKINDYFASKVPGGSPVRNSQGAKSPSPHQPLKPNVRQ